MTRVGWHRLRGMRRLAFPAAVVTAFVLAVSGCGGPDPVSYQVRYDLNMVGDRAFADISAYYTQDTGFETGVTEFGASWTHEVTVRHPDVEWVRLNGSFRFDTDVPGTHPNPLLSKIRCQIHIDGKLLVERTGQNPSCAVRLTGTGPTPGVG